MTRSAGLRRRRTPIVVTIGIVAIVAIVALTTRRPGSGTPLNPALRVAAPPNAYRIVYRVDTLAAQPFTTRWEELIVRRPFESRQVTYADRPTAPLSTGGSGNLSTIDHLYLVRGEPGSTTLQEISGRQPGGPAGDQALPVELDDAVRRRLAAVEGRRTVTGRPCRDIRFLEPVAGVIKPLTGSGGDVICIDGRGLALREEWTLQGRVVQRKEAVEIDVSPSSDVLDRAFDTSKAQSAPGAAGPEVSPPDAVGGFLAPPPAPAGFRTAVVTGFRLPAPQQLGSGPVALLYSSTVWAFRRGPDTVTVEAGTSTEQALPWSASDVSRSVKLPIGRGESVLRSDGPELRIDLGARRWLRVRGTVPLSRLVAYARGLKASKP